VEIEDIDELTIYSLGGKTNPLLFFENQYGHDSKRYSTKGYDEKISKNGPPSKKSCIPLWLDVFFDENFGAKVTTDHVEAQNDPNSSFFQ